MIGYNQMGLTEVTYFTYLECFFVKGIGKKEKDHMLNFCNIQKSFFVI